MRKLRFAIFIASLSGIFGCSKFDLIDRTISDYLNLDVGNNWLYVNQNGDTASIKITDFTYLNGDSVYVIDEDGILEYWRLNAGTVLKSSRFVVYPEGNELVIEDRFALMMETPFVLGNRWHELWRTTEHYRDQVFNYSHEVEGEVLGILDGFTVPFGTFDNVYKVRIINDFTLNDSIWSDTAIMFFAPEIGLVEKINSGDTLKLIDFRGGGE